MSNLLKYTWFSLALLFMIAVVFLLLPSNRYLSKALLHGKVNINDYQIFNNRIVQAGETKQWTLSTSYNQKEIPENYRGILEDLETVAFLVIKDSTIVHESYYSGYNQSSLSNSFSIAKSIIGLLVGCAIDEGSIKNVDQRVSDFIPEFDNERGKELTIKHLLTMSSGLDWVEKYTSPFSVTTQAYYGNDLKKLLAQCRIVEPVGEKFKYLSANTQILAFVLEKATGKHLAEYASEKLWKPIGASMNALWSLDKVKGVEKAYCCFNSNARDFARIGQLVLNKGMWNGKQLVSQKYVEDMTAPASWLQDEWGRKALDYYGYHWWITSFQGKKVVYARGILGQYIFVIPKDQMVVVRLGEKRCSLRTGNLPSDIYVWLNLSYLFVD